MTARSHHRGRDTGCPSVLRHGGGAPLGIVPPVRMGHCAQFAQWRRPGERPTGSGATYLSIRADFSAVAVSTQALRLIPPEGHTQWHPQNAQLMACFSMGTETKSSRLDRPQAGLPAVFLANRPIRTRSSSPDCAGPWSRLCIFVLIAFSSWTAFLLPASSPGLATSRKSSWILLLFQDPKPPLITLITQCVVTAHVQDCLTDEAVLKGRGPGYPDGAQGEISPTQPVPSEP